MRLLWLTLVVLVLPAGAQDMERRAHAVLHGVAVDSLRGGLLEGALVRVRGTTLMGVTDSLGRFRVDSVPAGSHSIELFHGLLDTLGMRVRTEPVAFGSDSLVLMVVGIPSGLTIAAANAVWPRRIRGR